MGSFSSVVSCMLTFFCIAAVGYVVKKLGMMNAEFDQRLSKLVISVTLPAMILGSVVNSGNLPSGRTVLFTMALGFAMYAVFISWAFFVVKVLRTADGYKGIFRFMLVFGNTGFIGFPVTSAVFGPDALIYASIFNLPFNLLCFSLGVWMIASDNSYGVRITFSPKTFLNPSVVSCLVAIVLALLGIHNVPFLGSALDTLGSFTTPAALLIVGSSLANIPVKSLLGTPRLWAISLVRLLVTPLLLWALFHGFVSNEVMLGVLVVTSGMPVANNGTMLCHQYNGDSGTMAQGTFITTALSVLTIPLLVLFLGSVL